MLQHYVTDSSQQSVRAAGFLIYTPMWQKCLQFSGSRCVCVHVCVSECQKVNVTTLFFSLSRASARALFVHDNLKSFTLCQCIQILQNTVIIKIKDVQLFAQVSEEERFRNFAGSSHFRFTLTLKESLFFVFLNYKTHLLLVSETLFERRPGRGSFKKGEQGRPEPLLQLLVLLLAPPSCGVLGQRANESSTFWIEM